ncbi:hypothetical protein AYK24_04230 [Thermoplasmatales archaeon SG8-52-4]|nr:MAG: hypothetical protein AYK24_04230 [Thermoplasmatales archaeon SG8-52-4]
MKKILTALMMLMILLSIPSLAIADETEEENGTEDPEIDNDTKKELEIMNFSLGAEIRLLQLQKAIIKNILKGEMAVEVLKALYFNTTTLEEILSNLKNLLEDVKAVNTSSNNSVQIFVELKYEAKNLTRQFRETIKDILDAEKLKEIRERIKNMISEDLQNYSKQIRNKIKQFNRNRLYQLYGIIGEANNSFINEYLNGNITLDQLKFQLCKTINYMNKERKYEIFSEIKKDNIKNKIKAQESYNNIKNKGKGKGYGAGK